MARAVLVLALGLQPGAVADEGACIAAFQSGEGICEQAGEDPCGDAACISAVENAAAKCRGGPYGYFDQMKQEYVNVTHTLMELQMMCNDPCMAQMMKCAENEETMSCSDECKHFYNNLGECAATILPSDDGPPMMLGDFAPYLCSGSGSPSPSMWSPSPHMGSPWSPSPHMGSPSPMWSPPSPMWGSPSPMWGSPSPMWGSPSPMWGSPSPVPAHSCRRTVKIPKAEADRNGAVRCNGAGHGGSSGGDICADYATDEGRLEGKMQNMDPSDVAAMCELFDEMQDVNNKYLGKGCVGFEDATAAIEKAKADNGCRPRCHISNIRGAMMELQDMAPEDEAADIAATCKFLNAQAEANTKFKGCTDWPDMTAEIEQKMALWCNGAGM